MKSKFWLVLMPAGSALLPFLLTPILVQKFEANSVGDFFFKFGMVSLLGTILLFGVDSEISWLASRNQGKEARYQVFNSSTFILVAILLLFFTIQIALHSANAWLEYTPVALSVSGFSASHLRIAQIRFGNKPWLALLVMWSVQFIFPSIGVILGRNYLEATWIWGISSFVFGVLISVKSSFNSLSFKRFSAITGQTFPLIAQAILFVFLPNVGRLLSLDQSTESLAKFQFSWTLVSVPLGFVLAINGYWSTLVFESRQSASPEHPRKSFPALLALIFIATLLTVIFQSKILELLGAPKIWISEITTQFSELAAIPTLFVFYLAAANLLVAERRYKVISALAVSVLLSSSILFLLFRELPVTSVLESCYFFLAFVYYSRVRLLLGRFVNSFWFLVPCTFPILRLAGII